MSAAKRRAQRQIARIVRMDRDFRKHTWNGTAKRLRLVAALRALGMAMTRRGLYERGTAAVLADRAKP